MAARHCQPGCKQQEERINCLGLAPHRRPNYGNILGRSAGAATAARGDGVKHSEGEPGRSGECETSAGYQSYTPEDTSAPASRPAGRPLVVVLFKSEIPAPDSAGSWLDSRCSPLTCGGRTHPTVDGRTRDVFLMLSLMMMDDVGETPWTCFESGTGTKDHPPLERTVALASLNNQSVDFQLGPKLHFLAFEPTSENQLRFLKLQTLALCAALGRSQAPINPPNERSHLARWTVLDRHRRARKKQSFKT